MPQSATVAKLELAHRMREYRAASGKTAREVSSLLGFSANYLSGLERGREVISADKLSELAEAYELGPSEQEDLVGLIETTKLVGWWERPPYAELLSDEMKSLCGLEFGASSATVYESVVVTGLLQTEAYAEALIAADALNNRASINPLLALRMKRQERLVGDDPLHLTVVMSEAALRQQIGGTDVLLGQLEHLLNMIDRHSDSLTVQVQPFEAAELALVGASTSVFFRFDHARLESLLWREAGVPVGISNDAKLLELFELNLGSAQQLSLSREDTVSLIRQRIAELKR